MSRYDEFRTMFGNASPEEKLMILRPESLRLLSRAHGYSLLMHELIKERKPAELPDDFGVWCQNVAESVEELQDLIDALTDWKHRSILKEERIKHEREFGEMLWKSDQQGLPELQNYISLTDAVEKTAHRLELLLLTPEIKIDDSSDSSVKFLGTERQVRMGAQASQFDRRYLGYAVTLRWLKDKRNLDWQEHEGLAPSLEEAVTVLHLWLVKEQDLHIIRREYPWMSSGRIQRNV